MSLDYSKPLQYALGTTCEPDWVDCDFVGKTDEHVVIAYRHGKVEVVRTMKAHLADDLLRNPVRKRTGYVCIDNKFCCLPEENPMWPISSPFAYGSFDEAKKHQDELGGRCIIVKVEWEE